MIKNTESLQITSLVLFANALGFYAELTESMNIVFTDERGYKVSVNSMINYHNGVFPCVSVFDGMPSYARILSRKLRTDIDTDMLAEAFNKRQVQQIKYRYSKKKGGFVQQYDTDNIVKLMPGVQL